MNQSLRQRHALKRKAATFALELFWACSAGLFLAVIVVSFLIKFLENPI